jgi:hypothetical protein
MADVYTTANGRLVDVEYEAGDTIHVQSVMTMIDGDVVTVAVHDLGGSVAVSGRCTLGVIRATQATNGNFVTVEAGATLFASDAYGADGSYAGTGNGGNSAVRILEGGAAKIGNATGGVGSNGSNADGPTSGSDGESGGCGVVVDSGALLVLTGSDIAGADGNDGDGTEEAGGGHGGGGGLGVSGSYHTGDTVMPCDVRYGMTNPALQEEGFGTGTLLPLTADYVAKSDVVSAEHVELDVPRWTGATGVGYVGTLEVGSGSGLTNDQAEQLAAIAASVAAKLDVAVSTRFAATDYMAPDNTAISAINAKTQNLPSEPAAKGDAMALTSDAVSSIWTAEDRTLSGFGFSVTVGAYESGLAPLDATEIRTAIGLAEANLDTQLADLPTVSEFSTRTIAADSYATSTVATAIKARTDLIPDDPASVDSAIGLSSSAISAIWAAEERTLTSAAGLTESQASQLTAIATATTEERLAHLDADISDTLQAADYTSPNNAGVASIAETVGVIAAAATETRLSKLDVSVSSRLAESGYTAPNNDGIAAIQSAATEARLARLDAAISTRLAAAGYTAPLSSEATAAIIATAVEELATSENVDAVLAAIEDLPSLVSIETAIMDGDQIAGKSLAAAVRYIGAVIAGARSGAGTTSETFKDFAGTTAVTGTVDANGNRSNLEYHDS